MKLKDDIHVYYVPTKHTEVLLCDDCDVLWNEVRDSVRDAGALQISCLGKVLAGWIRVSC